MLHSSFYHYKFVKLYIKCISNILQTQYKQIKDSMQLLLSEREKERSRGTHKCHKSHFLKYKEDWFELVFDGNFCQLHLKVFTQC